LERLTQEQRFMLAALTPMTTDVSYDRAATSIFSAKEGQASFELAKGMALLLRTENDEARALREEE